MTTTAKTRRKPWRGSPQPLPKGWKPEPAPEVDLLALADEYAHLPLDENFLDDETGSPPAYD
jgi:hypothetical protein